VAPDHEHPDRRPARPRRASVLGAAAAVALVGLAAVALLSPWEDSGPQPDPALLAEAGGGDTTAFEITDNAFGLSARNLGRLERRTFEIGDSLFTQNWVTAPASTELRDGLGPLLNAQACASCHVRDGRAAPPDGDDDAERGLLLRLSVPGPDGEPVPHPVYGGQLQDRAVLGVPAEGRIEIATEAIAGEYGDGTPFELLRPSYSIGDPAYGPPGDDLMISPRIAQQVIGMGLLEAIPEESVLAAADPDDADGDGISGRANRVSDPRTGKAALGRLGWKANEPTVESQVSGAFQGDIGITSAIRPDQPCTAGQTACREAPAGGSPEISDETLAKVVFYTQTLAVPGRRDTDDPQVVAGAAAFEEMRCTACHMPTQRTGPSEVQAAADQEIHPYTDLLLHDMGPGLADGRPDGEATGREWRTQPLWGLGLIEAVNGHTRLLHDGRARTIEEAVLWHWGEAEEARERFRTADEATRAALVRFLESL
jgi:CxxC motif-containing protein (DUF1111 family)